MSALTTSRAVIGARFEDVQAFLRNSVRTLPKTQVMREIPFNSIQACQRAMAAGAPSGLVVVDYIDSPHGARKLRVWDTGDGMNRTDLNGRLVGLSSEARTENNFGVGAKLSLTRVSPHGVVYMSMQDGLAHMARWQHDASTDQWGLAVLNPAGLTEIDQTVIAIDPAHLPEEIVKAGHGTSVTILGTSEDDPTAWTLRPEGSTSKRWALEALNERFTEFPEGIEMRVVMPSVEKVAGGGFRDDVRIARGSAGNLKYYTRDHKGASDPTFGARGKIRISGPVPATAYWWVLPASVTAPSYMRVGGKVKVVIDGEAYETHGARYMSTAGVWAQTTKVEIHFVPDPDAGVLPDLQRTSLSIDGRPLPLMEWCEEFKRNMPAAVRNLLAGSTKSRASGDFTAQLTELHLRLVSAPGARGRRSTRGTAEGTATGEVLTFEAPLSTSAAKAGVHRNPLRAAWARRAARLAGANAAGELVPGTGDLVSGEVVLIGTAPGAGGRRTRAVPTPPPMPSYAWVNAHVLDDDPELSELAGRFLPADNLLVLNCQGATYRKLLASYVHKYKDAPGAKEYVTEQVRDYFQLMLTDALLGAQRDFPTSWEALVTPETLTLRASGVYHIDTRLRQVFNRQFKGVGQPDCLEGDLDADAA